MPNGKCPKCGKPSVAKEGRGSSYCKEHATECQRRNRKSYPSEQPAHILCRNAKIRAKKRGIPFGITPADIVIPEFCPILGLRLVSGVGPSTRADLASLDRINPTLGYVRGNIAVISKRANQIKSDATSAELFATAEFVKSQGY